ncbi:MAG: chemotaxis-specific protein-glutamate methyltransferase CheB [Nitrospirae bacterium]|nr:chemotaxis-specific protein-glutamate methyltransferase CheB [Nitrospirota bacterium]
MIKVLVVEDSPVTREYLVALLEEDPRFQVVGTARNGLEAVEQAERLAPDVILMDVHMPLMNGYEATCRIMELVPTPIVMVSASISHDETAMAFEALKAGALTLLDKPGGPDHPDSAETVRQILETVKLMAEVKVVRRWPQRSRRPLRQAQGRPEAPAVISGRPIRLVAIGASTGGPQALAEILRGLPANLAAPILIVQHIAPGFTVGLVEWLGQATPLTVKLAEPDELARPGAVYVAPVGAQMGMAKDGRISLQQAPPEEGFCPSASYLLRSVAEGYGRSAIGVLLTGMGRDGATGLKRLREAGGITIVQDEESSVIFGMPAEAIRLRAAEHVLAPAQIAEMIGSLAGAGDRG